MLHHVALEIRPGDVARSVEMWEIAGFERVEAPAGLRERFVWLQSEGTQIHLALSDAPVVPQAGHAAVIAGELEATIAALEEAGFEVVEKRNRWDARRVAVLAPGGHRVELMEAPPG